MIKAIIRKVANNDKLPVKGGGCGNCNLVISNGARELGALVRLGMTSFIVCHDADTSDVSTISRIEENIMLKVIKPSGIIEHTSILVPIHEIESWVLADMNAVAQLFPSWKPKPKLITSPESIPKPCEYLESLSKINGAKKDQLYFHATDNKRVVQYLNFELVKKKCPSFEKLTDFVVQRVEGKS